MPQQYARKNKITVYKVNSIALNIASGGGTQQLSFVPNPNKIAKLLHIGVYVPAISGATSGTQYLEVGLGVDYLYNSDLMVQSATASGGTCQIGGASNSMTSELVGLEFDNNVPLVITVQNSSNAAQTGNMHYKLVWEEIDNV